MAKRGLNIYKRKDGRWEGRFKCGYSNDGKTKYRSVYAKSYSAVKELLEQEKSKQNKCCSCKCTVGELFSLWFDDVRNKVKESTYANYAMKMQKHILPRFSGMKYEALTAYQLHDFIQEKLSSGLSKKYVSDIVILMKSVARFGSRNYNYPNRIEFVTLPKTPDKDEKRLLNCEEQQRLQKELVRNQTPSNVGILLASTTGIRIGELCALKWSDIDLEKSILTVKQTVQRVCNIGKKGTHLVISSPKSRSSLRQIPLPDFISPVLMAARTADDCYIMSGTRKLVEPRTLQYRFKSLLKRLSLPQVSFHKLRHQFATRCVELGFDVKTLSEILGHHSVEVTLSRYVHSSIERKRDCMKLFSKGIYVA